MPIWQVFESICTSGERSSLCASMGHWQEVYRCPLGTAGGEWPRNSFNIFGHDWCVCASDQQAEVSFSEVEVSKAAKAGLLGVTCA